jgi:hypothetical protein
MLRPALDTGRYALNSFNVVTSVTSRALTVSAKAGTVAQLWVGDSTQPIEEVTANDIDFLITKAGDFYNQCSAFIPTTWRLETIKLYATNQLGKSPAGPNTWTPTAAWPGLGTEPLPPEMAMAVSLYTADRSKKGRGRIFVGPLSQYTTITGGLFTATPKDQIGNAMKALQDSVRTRGTPGSTATYVGIVWNRPGGLTVEPGTNGAVINTVRIGDEPDHQERRTKSRPETFTDYAVV